MVSERLNALAADLSRLLQAGSPSVPGDDGLRQQAGTFRQMGQKVPALAHLAAAIERVVTASPRQSSLALLDLLVQVRRAQASQAVAGVQGDLQPLPPSGPWRTPAAPNIVAAVFEVLTRKGKGRETACAAALEHGTIADLRLLVPLLRALSDSYSWLADLVAEQALPSFGRVILPELEKDFHLEGKTTDARRLTAIARIDKRAGIRLCRTAWREGSTPVRAAALRVLAKLAPAEAEEAACSALMGKSPAAVRVAAVAVLGELGPQDIGAIPALIRALGDPEDNVKWKAGHPLKQFGRVAVPALLPLLDSPDADLRYRAVMVLGAIGPEAEEAIPALLSRLEDPDQYLPWSTANALGRIGPAAKAAVPALKALCSHPQTHVRINAAEALSRITGRCGKMVSILIGALEDPDWRVQQDVYLKLDEMGSAAHAVVPVLVEKLRDRDYPLRHFAADTLAQLGQKARIVVPLLIEMVNESARHQRYWAIRALGRFGPRALAALPAIREAGKVRDSSMQRVAAAAIAAIENSSGSPSD
jgi:HEAT repeat protein